MNGSKFFTSNKTTMTKAEQFILEYTRNCSNEIIVPTEDGNAWSKGYEHWITPDQARRAVEIAREELVEKVCKYLQDHIDKDLTIYHAQTWLKRDEFIKKLKRAMEE